MWFVKEVRRNAKHSVVVYLLKNAGKCETKDKASNFAQRETRRGDRWPYPRGGGGRCIVAAGEIEHGSTVVADI